MWIVLGIIVDQLIKLWIVSRFAVGEIWPVFDGLTITLAMNRGVAFSLFAQSSGLGFWFLNAIIVLFNWFLIEFLCASEHQGRIYRFSLMLVITGALGNLMDRICYGAVVDYIVLSVGAWTWPTIFNLADVFISVGCLMLCVMQLSLKKIEASIERDAREKTSHS